jgi:sec-independent protein translocase protein TatA
MAPLFGWTPGWQELVVVAVIGLLLFGRRLPELGRSLGKGIVEFKKGLKGMEDEMDGSINAGTAPAQDTQRPPQRITSAAPKFDEAPNPSAPPKI